MNNRTLTAVAAACIVVGSVVGTPAIANATSDRKVVARIAEAPFGKTNDRTKPMPFGKTNDRQETPHHVGGPGFYRLFGMRTN